MSKATSGSDRVAVAHGEGVTGRESLPDARKPYRITDKRGDVRRVWCIVVGHKWDRFESIPTGEWWACSRCDAVSFGPVMGHLWLRLRGKAYRP